MQDEASAFSCLMLAMALSVIFEVSATEQYFSVVLSVKLYLFFCGYAEGFEQVFLPVRFMTRSAYGSSVPF